METTIFILSIILLIIAIVFLALIARILFLGWTAYKIIYSKTVKKYD